MKGAVERPSICILGPNSLQNTLLADYIANEIEGCCSKRIIEGPSIAQLQEMRRGESCQDTMLFVDADAIDASDIGSFLADVVARHVSRIGFFNVSFGELLYTLNESPYVDGVFQKQTPPSQFARGIQVILRGENWKPTQAASSISFPKPAARSEREPDLTVREREIIQLLTTGAKNREIAEQLYVSTHTVKTHVYNIYKKINVSTRLQAVNWATRNLF
jgi:LuxR family transcriptional regulator of csgAB operon